MKKTLLVATVLVGGVMLSQAGVSVSIRIGLPLPPLPAPVVVIRQPVPVCPVPVYVAPRVVVPCAPVVYRPAYAYRNPRWRQVNWNHHAHGYGYHR